MPRRKKKTLSYRKNAVSSYGGVHGRSTMNERNAFKNSTYYEQTADHRRSATHLTTVKNKWQIRLDEQATEFEQEKMSLIQELQQQQKHIEKRETQCSALAMDSSQYIEMRCSDDHDSDYDHKTDVQINNTSQRNRFSMEYIMEILNIGEYVSAKNIPEVVKSCSRICGSSVRTASASSCLRWLQCLPRIFTLYQCAVEFVEGKFNGDKKIEEEKKRIKEIQRKRQEIYSIKLLSQTELNQKLQDLSETAKRKLISKQLRVYEEMRKDDSIGFAYPIRITWSRKTSDELKVLFIKCLEAFDPRQMANTADIDKRNTIECDEKSDQVLNQNTANIDKELDVACNETEIIPTVRRSARLRNKQTQYCFNHCYDESEKGMICCDNCDEWYHYKCVNLTEQTADSIDKYRCPMC
eukprot:61198_1